MDTPTNPTDPDPLPISAYVTSSNLIRVNSSHSFTFPTDSIGVRAGSEMIFDWPDRHGMLLHGGSGPLVTIIQDGAEAPTPLISTAFGARFTVPLPFDLKPYSYYTVLFASVENIENPFC